MDKKYFEDLKNVIRIQMALTEHPCEIDENDEWLADILKQIVRDGAEAQKVADIEAAEKWEIKNGGYGLIRNMDSIIAAIESATVKWEVPSE